MSLPSKKAHSPQPRDISLPVTHQLGEGRLNLGPLLQRIHHFLLAHVHLHSKGAGLPFVAQRPRAANAGQAGFQDYNALHAA